MTMSKEGFLQIRQGIEGSVTTVELDQDRMVIGRSSNAEVPLPSQTVSRRHAELFKDPYGRWWARDLGSRNGTLLNGELIEEPVLLQLGDTLQIEDFYIRYRKASTMAGMRGGTTGSGMTMADAGITLSDKTIENVRSFDTGISPKVDASQLKTLSRFSGELLQTEKEETRLKMLCGLMVGEIFHGRAALALRVDKSRPDAEPVALCSPLTDGAPHDPYISKTLMKAVVEMGAPVVATAGQGNGRSTEVVELSLVAQTQDMSAVACPLRRDGDWMDVLYLTLPSQFGTPEWLALAALACDLYEQAENSWETRYAAQEQAIIEKELQRAHRIQMRLVPKDFKIQSLEVGFGFEPCKWVGGDYVDSVPMRDGRMLITVMDVCGKGMQAALITNGLHTTTHLLADQGHSLVNMVSRMNSHLVKSLPDESFVTALVMAIDPSTGHFEAVNCGHPPAFIVAPDGATIELSSGDYPPLGYLDMDYEAAQGQLESLHMLCAYSDGLSEMTDENERMLGIDGVRQMISEIYCEPTGSGTQIKRVATHLSESLRSRLNQYQGNSLPDDDSSYFILLRR